MKFLFLRIYFLLWIQIYCCGGHKSFVVGDIKVLLVNIIHRLYFQDCQESKVNRTYQADCGWFFPSWNNLMIAWFTFLCHSISFACSHRNFLLSVWMLDHQWFKNWIGRKWHIYNNNGCYHCFVWLKPSFRSGEINASFLGNSLLHHQTFSENVVLMWRNQ